MKDLSPLQRAVVDAWKQLQEVKQRDAARWERVQADIRAAETVAELNAIVNEALNGDDEMEWYEAHERFSRAQALARKNGRG